MTDAPFLNGKKGYRHVQTAGVNTSSCRSRCFQPISSAPPVRCPRRNANFGGAGKDPRPVHNEKRTNPSLLNHCWICLATEEVIQRGGYSKTNTGYRRVPAS